MSRPDLADLERARIDRLMAVGGKHPRVRRLFYAVAARLQLRRNRRLWG